jgi:hypothetical protein
MKRAILILMVLTIVSILCAFPKGTINPGGQVYFQSYKADSDADAMTTIAIMPQVGYFFIDNLAADVLVNYISQSQGDDSASQFDIGLGARYFYNKFYGGLGFLHNSMSWENGVDIKKSGNYLELKGGYLLQPARNVYLDLGLKYRMGLGKYGGDFDEIDNEESMLMIGAGLQIFYHTDVLGK